MERVSIGKSGTVPSDPAERCVRELGRDTEMTTSITEAGRGRVVYYLCQQVMRQGQGSFAHVSEIIGGLSQRGWRVRLFQPAYGHKDQVLPLALRLPYMIQAEMSLVLWSGCPLVCAETHSVRGGSERFRHRRRESTSSSSLHLRIESSCIELEVETCRRHHHSHTQPEGHRISYCPCDARGSGSYGGEHNAVSRSAGPAEAN
jgi:hypothetical protein